TALPFMTNEQINDEFDELASSDFEDKDTALSIRECECFPNNETKAQCKARISRIVEKQKRCYGIKSISKAWLTINRGKAKGNPSMARPRIPLPTELRPNELRRGYDSEGDGSSRFTANSCEVIK